MLILLIKIFSGFEKTFRIIDIAVYQAFILPAMSDPIRMMFR